MRYAQRARHQMPRVLESSLATEYRREVDTYLASGNRELRPPRPPGSVLDSSELRDALAKLFEGTCAFCETSLTQGGLNIEHYRPWDGADRGEGGVDFRHYCWLALDWSNLYPACDACQRAKRNLFPVYDMHYGQEDPRNYPVEGEGPLLLDPCKDAPAAHLRVESGGELSGIDERGTATIEVLALNRRQLIEARSNILQMLGLGFERTPLEHRIRMIGHAVADRLPFAGIVLIRLIQELPEHHPFRAWAREPLTPGRAQRLLEARAGEDRHATPGERRRLSVMVEEQHYIRRVKVENFRGVEHAVIDFPSSGGHMRKGAGSLVLLGENAAGKTSVLQAAALGALGPTRAMEAGMSPARCLRDGARRGAIQVEFWDTDATNLVTFERGAPVLGGHSRVYMTVLGYGAYRLPARKRLRAESRRSDYRIHSLLEERNMVNGPYGLEDHFAGGQRDRAEDAVRALNEMLTGAARAHIDYRGRLRILENEHSRALTDLSSGLKSILSIGTDVMDVLYERWGSMSSGQAFILIDEIDAHLHPEWRLRVVEALRNAFPLSQFLLTTHDPLVLRGMATQEIRLIGRREDGGTHIEPPRVAQLDGLDVDQLLTSDLFGLSTTLRPEIDRDLRAYYDLLAQPGGDDDRDQMIVALRERLAFDMPMGATRRERLLYEVIDRYLARSARDQDADVWDEGTVEAILAEFERAAEEDGDDPAA